MQKTLLEQSATDNQKQKVLSWLVKANLSDAELNEALSLMQEFEQIKMPTHFLHDHKKILFRFFFNHREQIKANAMLPIIIQVMTGDSIYYLFKNNNHDKRKIIQCLDLIAQQGKQHIDKLKKLVAEASVNKLALDDLIGQIQKISIKKLFPQPSPQDVYRQFSVTSVYVTFLLSEQDRQKVFAQYDALLKYREEKQLAQLSTPALKEIISELNKKRGVCNSDDIMMLLAVACEVMKRDEDVKVEPYHKQLLVVLALLAHPPHLRGRLAQDLTGEGKSTVNQLLALCLIFQGQPSGDLITSAKHLAIRDAKKYKNFFKQFNLTTCHMCTDTISKEQCEADIAYGRGTDFEFSYLRFRLNMQQYDRPRHFVIVDEADYTLFDSALNSARIATPLLENDKDIVIEIFNSVKSLGKESAERQQNLTYLLQSLREKFGEHRKLLASDELFTKYYRNAIKGIFNLKEDEDYIVKEVMECRDGEEKLTKEIISIDPDTGEELHGSKWSYGLHNFIELKHKLAFTPELQISAAITHSQYFNLYKRMYGLSGTLGDRSLREECFKTYQVDTFDAPPRIQKKLKSCPPNSALLMKRITRISVNQRLLLVKIIELH